MSVRTSPIVASIEISLDHQLQYLLGSRKGRKETGRFLSAKDATEKLYNGHTVTCSVGVAGTVKKTYTPHPDGSVYILEGGFNHSLLH